MTEASGPKELSVPPSPEGGETALDNVFYRELFEGSPEGIVQLDNEDRVIEASTRADSAVLSPFSASSATRSTRSAAAPSTRSSSPTDRWPRRAGSHAG